MSGGFWYRGHGLLINSDITLPEFGPAASGTADITVSLGSEARAARAEADHAGATYGGFLATPAGPVLSVPEIADFLVRDGREILITPAENHDPGMLRLYLVGSAMGMLFHQRGQLVLHGAAVVHPRGVSVFVGTSGAGKSTLAAHLGASGHAVLADDTLPLVESPGPVFQAWPGSRVFKLWGDALSELGTTTKGLSPIGQRFDKYFVKNPSIAPEALLPLDEIILLDTHDAPPKLESASGIDALGIVSENAYRPEYVPLLGREASHFRLAASLSAVVRVLRLHRPWDASRMEETIACLEAHWAHLPQIGASD